MLYSVTTFALKTSLAVFGRNSVSTGRQILLYSVTTFALKTSLAVFGRNSVSN